MSATLRQIVDDALAVMGEVAGVGTQAFSDDKLKRAAVKSFNLLFKKKYWPQYTQWFQLALDGTLGIVTTDAFTRVMDFEDFAAVHRDGQSTALSRLPKSINPYTVTGNTVTYWTSLPVSDARYATRRLQFYPKTSVGLVNICARVYPLPASATQFGWDDVFDLDRDMLADGAAFLAFIGDDLNPGAADTCRQMMEMRFRDIEASLASQPLPIATGPSIPNAWQEWP